MNLLPACVVLPLAVTTLAQPPTQIWSRQFGTPQDDDVRGIVADGSGGIIVGGHTYGSLGGPNAGFSDLFLARFDGAGNQIWARQFGTSAGEIGAAMATPGSGTSLIVGFTSGTLGAASHGGIDAFLAQYDAAGNQVWIKQFGTSSNDHASGVATSGAGDVIVGGTTAGSLGGPNAGGEDAFIARLDLTTQSILWVRQVGTSAADLTSAVAFDGAGGAYLAGYTSGNLAGLNMGNYDAFLMRVGAAGNVHWVRQIGTTGAEYSTSVAPDGAGGVIWCGTTTGALAAPNAGVTDIFLARYDSAGNQVWIRQFGSSATDFGSVRRLDGDTLFFGSTLDGLFGATSSGGYDAVLARFDAVANQFQWGLQFGTGSDDVSMGVATDGPDVIFVAGGTDGSLAGPNAGGDDAFIVRYGYPCYPDCNADTLLNLADFGCFQTKFVLSDPYADCNADTFLNLADFGCFQTRFALACP